MDKALKDDCTAWGKWMRTGQPTGYARRGVLGRLKEEGNAAGEQGGLKDYVPILDPPYGLQYIYSAWVRHMDSSERAVFMARFVAKGSPKQKAEALGLTVATFYRRLDAAMLKVSENFCSE